MSPKCVCLTILHITGIPAHVFCWQDLMIAMLRARLCGSWVPDNFLCALKNSLVKANHLLWLPEWSMCLKGKGEITVRWALAAVEGYIQISMQGHKHWCKAWIYILDLTFATVMYLNDFTPMWIPLPWCTCYLMNLPCVSGILSCACNYNWKSLKPIKQVQSNGRSSEACRTMHLKWWSYHTRQSHMTTQPAQPHPIF